MKRMTLVVALAGGVALSTAPAFAQMAAVSAPAPDDNAVVCKRLDPPTGSHLPQPPICHTKAEWKQMQSLAQSNLQELQQVGTMHNMKGN